MFVIQKTITGNFYHIYNNQSTKVNVSDFDVVLDDVALTFIIQCKNGSNIPSQAISISLIQVVDLSVGTSPIPFSGVDGLILLLKSISYTPYLQSLIVTTPVTVYRVGQVGIFTMTPTQYTNNFDSSGLGQSVMLGWALRNGNNETKNQLGKFSLNKGVAPYDVIGNIGGNKDAILVQHSHTVASYAGVLPASQRIDSDSTTDIGGNTTSTEGESGVGKNMPPYLIDVWVERVTDLVINVGQGGGGGGAVDSVNGQTGDVYIPLDYLPLAGGTMDAGADINFDNGSTLREGTYNFGGSGGISRICSVNYEDMWQGGIRHVFDNSGFIRHSTNCFNIVPDSSFDNTLRFKVDSLWTLDNGDSYKCLDASTGASVWELVVNIPNLGQVLTIQDRVYKEIVGDYLIVDEDRTNWLLYVANTGTIETITLDDTDDLLTVYSEIPIKIQLDCNFAVVGTDVRSNLGVDVNTPITSASLYRGDDVQLKKLASGIWFMQVNRYIETPFELQLTQSSTDAPVIVTDSLKGNRGATITTDYADVGDYKIISDLPIFADLKDCFKGGFVNVFPIIDFTSQTLYNWYWYYLNDYQLRVVSNSDAIYYSPSDDILSTPVLLKAEYKQ